MTFPKDFAWGVGTSAYQIEGYGRDGRGPSIWDDFCDRIKPQCNHASAEVACDHLHHLEEDIGLLRSLGVNSYRFSIGWPRILPEGVGDVNHQGLDFYNRLVDGLLEAGITPHLTLFHWDYPRALQEQGGWMNPDSADWFAEFTAVVVRHLSDRVGHWYTVNEPACFTSLGLHEGQHAPGLKRPFRDLLQATKHVMLAHGKAAEIIRMESKLMPRIGFAHVSPYFYTDREEKKLIKNTARETFKIGDKSVFKNAWWLDLMVNGQVPEDAAAVFGEDMVHFSEEDLIQIAQPLDFIGVNVYFGHEVAFNQYGTAEWPKPAPGAPRNDSGWPIQPELLYWTPRFFYERYHLPIVISENGFSNLDWIHTDGRVHDPQRIDFIQRHLLALKQALDEGIPISGYFYWTLMDNFEWTEGYEKRFGLVHVDFTTQQRTIKDSGFWYRDLIACDGKTLHDNPFEGSYGTYRPDTRV